MRQFIKYTLASITGIVIVSIAALLLFIIVAVGIAASDKGGVEEIKDQSVLVVKLKGEIAERVEENPLGEMMGETASKQSIMRIVGAIDEAATNDNIKGIYIEAGMVQANTAALQEIRKALVRFRAANPKGEKWIVSFADEYTQGAYYVCSAADKIWINPKGMLDLHGLSAQPMYLKDLLAKVGVKMKVVKVGKYKSATEQYTEDHMSDANREQVTRYVNGLWGTIRKDISEGRRIPQDSIDSYADQLTAFQDVEMLIKRKLVDKAMYADQVKVEIKGLLKIDKDDEINQVDCYTACNQNIPTSSNKIAIYRCEGSIVQTPEAGVVMGDAGIVSSSMIEDLNDLAKDDEIKAVVIRINSGGGDAFASEQIWHAVMELRKKKPVVVSMGGAAASGAYYLSAGASWIVAQETTLTGSIGIFGCFPDMSGLMTEKLGLKFDNVSTNRHSDFDITQRARPFNSEEEAILQGYINRGYDLFCKRVSDGRKIPMAKVKEIAQGRVWLGTDAIGIKLVDQLGGMKEAIAKAVTLAKISDGDYELNYYPVPASWFDQLLEQHSERSSNLDEQLRSTLGTFYEPFILVKSLDKQNPIQARMEWVMEAR